MTIQEHLSLLQNMPTPHDHSNLKIVMHMQTVLPAVSRLYHQMSDSFMRPAAEQFPLRADEIIAAIDRVVTDRAKVLVVHSSMPALAGTTRSVLHWQVVQAMRRLVQRGLTLVFPSFTFSYGKGKSFDLLDSASETGILADWMRVLPEAVRTPNPIFSFVVLGEQSARFAAADHTDAYGDHSVLALFEELDAEIVMLGAKWDYCSFLHRMEQEHRVPYREFKHFSPVTDIDSVPARSAFRVFVRRLDILTRLDFGVVKSHAEREGLLRSVRLGASEAQSVRVRDLASLCRRNMAEDPLFLLCDKPQVAHALAQADDRRNQPAFRVALLGSANIDVLRSDIEREAATLAGSRKVEFYVPGFGQASREIFDPDSALHRFDPHFSIFCDTAESLLDTAVVGSQDPEVRKQRLQLWIESVEQWLRLGRGRTAVLDPLISRSEVQGSWAALSEAGTHRAFARLRDDVRRLLDRFGGVLIDTAAIAADSNEPLFDARLWYLARIAWGPGFSRALAGRIGGLIAAETGQTIRLIVVDLDNTLWGGIAGEDGPKGLQLGGDGPGRAFCDFQAALRLLSRRGIALAIASKNDEDTAWQVIDHHPDMVLRRQDFVAWQINWEPKPANIATIAAQLNLSLSNVLFIDDNPVERRAVQQMLPAVSVLQIGSDPAWYLDALTSEHRLEAAILTGEDADRTASFRRMSESAAVRNPAKSFADFVADLSVVVRLSDLTAATLGRASQLMVKTNQFNSSLRRYNQDQLQAIITEGGTVATIEVQDAINPPEIMGLVTMRAVTPDVLDSIVLSCRALGKGVETSLFRHLVRKNRQHLDRDLLVQYAPSQRNGPVRRAMLDAGLREFPDGWRAGPEFEDAHELAVTIDDRICRKAAI